MRTVSGVYRRVLVGFLSVALATPFPAWSGSASLGTARGLRTVELSLDGGKTWLPLGARSLPVMEGSQIRTTNGSALLDLTDGSQVNVLPFSAVRFRETGHSTELSVLRGRLTFRLLPQTRVEIWAPAARLEPVRDHAMVGELFVGPQGTMGLKMAQGKVQVQELSGEQRTMLAGREPVFLPKRPAASGPLFSSETPAAPPAGAKGVFTPRGESLGYLRSNAQLVAHPGYTADLTQPFPAKLVQLAMAKIPETARSDATPLFDVNGEYVGYVAGPVFYAPSQIAQAQLGTRAPEGEGTPPYIVAGVILGVVLTAGVIVGLVCAAGGGPCGGEKKKRVATPF